MNNNKYNEVILSDNIMHSSEESYLTVIMPAYNEGTNIKGNLLKASELISKFVNNYHIIAVNDGSIDNTESKIIDAAHIDPKISYISYSPNQGKGYAIATGVKYANSEYIAFLDSDLELDPGMLKHFLKGLLDNDADIAIGSKLHKDSKLHYPLIRRIMSMGYYIILKILFNLKIKDTQTGIKLFKAQVIKPICDNLTTTGFAFDIEILVKSYKAGYKIIEMPIELKYSRNRREKSRFSLKLIFNIFKDTLKIKKSIRKK